MGTHYGFTSWALHMALLILFSNIYGWLFREWEGASTLPKKILHVGMAAIVVAALVITYGNYLGEKQATATAVSTEPAPSQRRCHANIDRLRHSERTGTAID